MSEINYNCLKNCRAYTPYTDKNGIIKYKCTGQGFDPCDIEKKLTEKMLKENTNHNELQEQHHG